jgi:hypothetical protein
MEDSRLEAPKREMRRLDLLEPAGQRTLVCRPSSRVDTFLFMRSRRQHGRNGMISAVAAIAVWVFAAIAGTRSLSSNDALALHAAGAEAPSAPLPAVRGVAVERPAPTRPEHRSTGLGVADAEGPRGSLSTSIPRKRAVSIVFGERHVRPRRLAFRYDATAPPTAL